MTQTTKAKAATKAKAPTKAITSLVIEGTPCIDCRFAPEDVKETVQSIMQEVIGYYEARKYNYVYPVPEIIGYRDNIVDELDNYGASYKGNGKYKPVVDALDQFAADVQTQLASKLTHGHIEFGDVPYVFKEGDEVVSTIDGEVIAGIVDEVKLQHTFFGPMYQVQFKVINNVFGRVQESSFTVTLGYFKGLVKLAQLPVRHLDAEVKADLQTRGEYFRKYTGGVHYVQYQGQLTRSSWWSPRRYRADGRVILDVNSFSQVDNNQFSQEGSQSGLDGGDRYDRSTRVTTQFVLKDEDLWRTYPFLYGFSFAAKQWGRMSLSGLSDINFRTDAFDKLVLPEEDKELVKAIVQDQGGDFSDLIDGKGGGSIFLLHGPPGQGKTLTAEAIAEELQRPLYSISVGELGTSPQHLESTLRQILDVATIWNAVLLLDEADIFLEERDEKDIVRNAMVGVFLRLLEYHQGVLFLTTNRVKNIDQAFYSRISIGLRFGQATVEKRKSIWTNLTVSAQTTGLDLDTLAQHDLNGRQIKNVIKTAQKLANYKGIEVDTALIEQVIERTSNFAQDDTDTDQGNR